MVWDVRGKRKRGANTSGTFRAGLERGERRMNSRQNVNWNRPGGQVTVCCSCENVRVEGQKRS